METVFNYILFLIQSVVYSKEDVATVSRKSLKRFDYVYSKDSNFCTTQKIKLLYKQKKNK